MNDMKEIKEKVKMGLEKARYQLLSQSPFIGEMLLRFSIVPTYDNRFNTAATDGTSIFFDCEFYSKLTQEEREFVLAHEVWHNIFLHFARQGVRDRNLWNIATDMEINHMLKNEGMSVLKGACMPDPIVAGKSAEDIYAWLQKENKTNKKEDGDGDGDDGDDGDGEDSKGSSGPSKSNGGSGKHGNQFDTHICEGDSADSANGGNEGEADGKWGKRENDADYAPSMKNAKEIADQITEKVCSAAQSIERRKGSLPAGIDHIVKEMLKPEINWKERLSMFVTRVLGEEHSWRRVSRHALGRGMYLPGRTDDSINIGLVLDTSGSYLQDLPKFLAELDALLKSFGKYKILLVQCDCKVQDVKEYDDSNPIDVSGFKVKGGGGSDFRPAFKYLREHGDDFNAVIAFTDGYIDVPTYAPPYPTLFVLPNDGSKDFCEWGEKMVFKSRN